MDFDAVQRTVGQIIQTGEHIVPRYQRPYAWDHENATDLWRDLKERDDAEHFLGNMVVHQSGPSETNRWNIVDGQQRLTTVLIALRAIKDAYESLGEHGRAQGLSNFLQYVDLSGKTVFRLQHQHPTESGYFQLRILSEPESVIREARPKNDAEKAQFDAYAVFANSITSELTDSNKTSVETLDSIRDRFLQASVVYVRVNDRQSAFRIFETLNDRGKSLNQVDLVKNQVISSIIPTAAREEEILWARSIESIESSNWPKSKQIKAEDFLGYTWNSTSHQPDNEAVTTKRIRRSVDAFLHSSGTQEERAREFVCLFSQTADIFREFDSTLDSPNGKHWAHLVPTERWLNDRYADIDRALYGCLVPESNLPLPLLFSLLRNYIFGSRGCISKARLVDFLTTVENLQFRWSISQRPSTASIRSAYRRAAYAVDSAADANDIFETLRSFKRDANHLMPTDAQFKEGLKRLTYFNQKPQHIHRIRHTLAKIEECWGESKLGMNHSITLEHIEPQGGKSINSPQNFWIGKLGNLMLLPTRVNSSLPDNFHDKAPTLQRWSNAKDLVLQEQASRRDWNNATANKRMDALLNAAVSVWPKEVAI